MNMPLFRTPLNWVAALLLALTLLPCVPAIADNFDDLFNDEEARVLYPLRYASWHIPTLETDSQINLEAIASVMRYFDFVAIQAKSGDSRDALESLRHSLSRESSSRWEYITSREIDKTQDNDLSFFWRASRVTYMKMPYLYPNTNSEFTTPPFSALFIDRRTLDLFMPVNILVDALHKDDEIAALTYYWEWLKSQYGDLTLVFSGDFNASPYNFAFDELTRWATPLIDEGANTIGGNGRYKLLTSNIWYDRQALDNRLPLSATFDILDELDAPAQAVTEQISAYAPVFSFLLFE